MVHIDQIKSMTARTSAYVAAALQRVEAGEHDVARDALTTAMDWGNRDLGEGGEALADQLAVDVTALIEELDAPSFTTSATELLFRLEVFPTLLVKSRERRREMMN